MIHAIENLQRLYIERKKVVISGEKGRIELAVYGEGIVSVFYTVDTCGTSDEGRKFQPFLFSDRFADLRAARQEWESIFETDNYFELRHRTLRILVDKATATVSAYDGDLLVHGGPIGDKDTVVPSYPLRVQQDRSGSAQGGKFNFRLEEDDAFFGLGEKSGSLNKRNRAFKMFNRDALGYDAEFSDPLYKSVPFFIKANRASGAACGLYFPNLRVNEVNFGAESRFYYHVALDSGPYGYFLLTGPDYGHILGRYAELCGAPALPPLFSFGYLASSMAYTDPDDATARVLGFFDRVEREGIPCEGMYFSSGYARADNGERYTFHWNRRKFPDPATFLGSLRARGYRICCNVKPGILTTHPWYADMARDDVFIRDLQGAPYISYYWGNTASFVDFSREAGYRWWQESLTRNILEQGASGVWNDNNEFELENESLPAQEFRSILPVLMCKASYEAMRAANPGKRPWNISRAGYAGLQRYARTWTGDNVSDWRTLRNNLAMGYNLGLSGMPIYGHDIGGFFGPHPGAELLVRWCQSGVFQPRFVMHSWKPDGTPTEPWTYPEAAGAITGLIRERYRFLPYIYNAAIEAHLDGMPMERPLALEYPGDSSLDYDCLDRLCGPDLLVPAPPGQGEQEIEVRLPSGTSWFEPGSERYVEGGSVLRLDYPLDGVRYLIRAGSIVPTNPRADSPKGWFPELRFLVVPPFLHAALGASTYIEDDGESDFLSGSFLRYRFEFEAERETAGEPWILRATLTDALAMDRRQPRMWRFALPPEFMFETVPDSPCSLSGHGSEASVDCSGLPAEFRLRIVMRPPTEGLPRVARG